MKSAADAISGQAFELILVLLRALTHTDSSTLHLSQLIPFQEDSQNIHKDNQDDRCHKGVLKNQKGS